MKERELNMQMGIKAQEEVHKMMQEELQKQFDSKYQQALLSARQIGKTQSLVDRMRPYQAVTNLGLYQQMKSGTAFKQAPLTRQSIEDIFERVFGDMRRKKKLGKLVYESHKNYLRDVNKMLDRWVV